eukprot:scaffold17802_cov35-Tisochrysis_lutea.AAC.4
MSPGTWPGSCTADRERAWIGSAMFSLSKVAPWTCAAVSSWSVTLQPAPATVTEQGASPIGKQIR